MNRKDLWLSIVPLILLLIPVLSAPQVHVVQGLDDSSMLVTVSNDRFHVEINLRIQLSIEDLTQFIDTEDAYSEDEAIFNREVQESIEEAVQELSEDATVINIDVDTVECHEDRGKMHVVLSFDVEGAIESLDGGGRRYDLAWRSFKADKKFSIKGTTIQPDEDLGLDFSDFDDDLDDSKRWTVSESNGNTVIRQEQEYDLETDNGEVDLRVAQKFMLSGTNLTINANTVEEKPAQQATQQEQPMIPGFPWEAILLSLALATTVIILKRRRCQGILVRIYQ